MGSPPHRLPRLDEVRIANPCDASWDAMQGDDRVRFCAACGKHVYNLSAMPRLEAERLLADREGSICKRLYRRDDGTVITTDCPVGVRRLRLRQVVAATAGAGAMAVVLALYRGPGPAVVAAVAAAAPPTRTVGREVPPPAPLARAVPRPEPRPPPKVEMGF